jgi:hypothetical protein
MTMAYRGMSVEGLGSLSTIEARRRHVFDAYTQRMFERRKASGRYLPKQTIHWLAWLARNMSQHAQSVFIIERLQPSWLQTRNQKRLYALGSRVVIGLIIGLLVGLPIELFLGLVGLDLVLDFLGSWLYAWGSFIELIFVGLIAALLFLGLIGLIIGLTGFLIGLTGLTIGLVVGLINIKKFEIESIKLVEALEWSWAAVRNEIRKRGHVWLREVRTPGEIILTDFPFAYFRLAIKLAGALSVGLSSTIMEEKMDFRRGARQSMKHALIAGFVGTVYGVVYGGFVGLVRLFLSVITLQLPSDGLGFVSAHLVLGITILGPVYGLISGLRYGGLAVIQHYTLRFILCLNGHIPWNYTRFLDYATGRIFLRKVGGGYIFIHRLLMEYFASLEDNHTFTTTKEVTE